MCSKTTNFAVGIIISVWTVVQTSFHVLWTLGGHYLYACKIKASHYILVILYLTYFYNSQCGDITIENDDMFSHISNGKRIASLSEITNETELFTILQLIVEKAQFPKEATHAFRTNIYMIVFIFLDAIWLLTAFLLFAGTCFQVKRCTSLFFYCPWLVVTGIIIILDVVASVHFGLDLLKLSRTYTSWLKFIGISNFKDFSDLNEHPSSQYIPIESSIAICILFSRFVFLWILNIVNFSQILNIALLAYQNKTDDKEGPVDVRRRSRKVADSDLNLDTSASRIRSWQLFYGAIETTSTTSSVSQKSIDRDPNTFKRKKTSFRVQTPSESEANMESFDHRLSTIRSNSDMTFETAQSHYMRFSDVADVLETGPRHLQRRSNEDSSRSQMPWTYVTCTSTNSGFTGSEDKTFQLSDSVNRNKRRTTYYKSPEEVYSTAL